MFGHAWRIGRIRGIDLRIDASWVLVAVLVAASFASRLDDLYGDRIGAGARLALAVASSLAFFGSVLLHEIAHALTARRLGVPVGGITLFLFGGATEAKVEGRTPRDELLVTAAGPLTTLVLASGLGVAAHVAGDTADPIPGTIGSLAWLNLVLLVFNLVPGLPLDGGRLLRAAMWATTGNLVRATRVAASGGQILGWLLMAIGVLDVLAGYLGGLWMAGIGWFLSQAARLSYQETLVSTVLRRVEAEEVMAGDPVSIPGDLPLPEAIEAFFLRRHHSAYPVTDHGRVVGLLTLRGIRSVPAADRAGRVVRDVMTPLVDVQVVPGTAPMSEVVQRLAQTPDARVLVRGAAGGIDGIITSKDVARWVHRADELGVLDGPVGQTRTGR